jgi:PAS domain S-box-containing protein
MSAGSAPTTPRSPPASPPVTRRLRTHLVAFALALLLPALAVGAVVTWQAVAAYRGAFEGRLEDTARALALAMDREIDNLAATISGLSTTRLLDAGATAADLQEFRVRASELAAALGSHVTLVGPPPDYRTQLHTRIAPGAPLPAGLRLPPADAPLPRVFATGRPAIGGVARGATLGVHTAFLFVPVIRDGTVIRAIGIALDPARFARLLQAQGQSGGAVTAVVDSRGNIAARSRDHERFVGLPAAPWYVQGIRDRAIGLLHGTGLDGEGLVLGFAQLGAAPGWTVAVAEPRSAYVASWQRPLLSLALGGGAVLALGLGLAMWLGSRLIRPLDALAADAEAVAKGGEGDASPGLSAPPSTVTEFEALRRGFVAADAALRQRAEAAQHGEERLRLAVEGTGMATWEMDAATGRVTWSRHHFLMLGQDPDRPEEASIEAWRARVHPEDLGRVEAEWARAGREGGRFHVNYRIRRADDGEVRWMESYGRHIRDRAGPGRFVGVMFDVTERKLAEERQQLLMREVDHRAKNALAVVQSVVRLTRAEDPVAYAASVEGRVRALARAHDLLARDLWRGAGLHDIAAEELAAYLEAGRAEISGPSVRLAAEAAQPVSMVLHELATNAAKHGALSRAEGRIALTWAVDALDGALRLHWREQGGPTVAGPPRRRGFGSRLVEATLGAQLGGKAAFAWDPAGLRCDLTIPASRLVAATRGTGAEAPPTPPSPRSGALGNLSGLRLLVVEDEALIATDLADTLRGLGCHVIGPAGTLEEGMRLAESADRLDAALLDVNLHGQPSFPLATMLAARGVPVVFATGYSALPEGSGGLGARVLRKPVAPVDIATALRAAVERPPSGPVAGKAGGAQH